MEQAGSLNIRSKSFTQIHRKREKMVKTLPELTNKKETAHYQNDKLVVSLCEMHRERNVNKFNCFWDLIHFSLFIANQRKLQLNDRGVLTETLISTWNFSFVFKGKEKIWRWESTNRIRRYVWQCNWYDSVQLAAGRFSEYFRHKPAT